MEKIYELTTNGMDGYRKYYVKGLKSDSEAKALAKKVFKKNYWESGISHYDNHPSEHFGKTKWKNTPRKSKFIKDMRGRYN